MRIPSALLRRMNDGVYDDVNKYKSLFYFVKENYGMHSCIHLEVFSEVGKIEISERYSISVVLLINLPPLYYINPLEIEIVKRSATFHLLENNTYSFDQVIVHTVNESTDGESIALLELNGESKNCISNNSNTRISLIQEPSVTALEFVIGSQKISDLFPINHMAYINLSVSVPFHQRYAVYSSDLSVDMMNDTLSVPIPPAAMLLLYNDIGNDRTKKDVDVTALTAGTSGGLYAIERVFDYSFLGNKCVCENKTHSVFYRSAITSLQCHNGAETSLCSMKFPIIHSPGLRYNVVHSINTVIDVLSMVCVLYSVYVRMKRG